MATLIIISVIVFLSLIQSVVGVGLLVFGTPTFMFLGYTFQETLSIVLPPSIIISLLQIFDSPSVNGSFKAQFNKYCLPFVVAGSLFTLFYQNEINLQMIIGSMLLLSGIIRFSKKFEIALCHYLTKHKKAYLILLGCIHGFTNMGGGLLAVFSSSIHKNNKVNTRGGIAHGYFFMGLIQYSLLILYSNKFLTITTVCCSIAAALTYFFIGKKVFINTQEKFFMRIITAMILVYGLLMILK